MIRRGFCPKLGPCDPTPGSPDPFRSKGLPLNEFRLRFWPRFCVVSLLLMACGLTLASTSPLSAPAAAFPGTLQLPTPPGETWYICKGYASGFTHAAPSFAIDLTAGSPCNKTAGANKSVYAPASGTVVRYETRTGSLCINMDGGGSIDVTHILGTPTSGRVSKGQTIGTVAVAGAVGNNGMAHIHLEVSPQPNCQWVSGRYLLGSTPFDSAHGTRLECAPDLYAGGPVGLAGQGQWSGKAVANTCQEINNGDFVLVRESGAVFRLAGGAPIYVSTWSAFGGAQPVKTISQAQLDAMRAFPADGSFIVGAQRGEVYRVAGGAPVYVSTWSAFGGAQPVVVVDQAAIDSAGAGGVWNHLRFVPLDGSFITGAQTGRVYRVGAGAPRYIPSWDPYGGPRPTTVVDQNAVNNAGSGGAWNHLRVPTPVVGDVNVDGFVDCADKSTLLANFGRQSATPGMGDLNGDGQVSVLDLSILIAHWAPAPGDTCT